MPFYPRTRRFRVIRSGPLGTQYRVSNREKWLQDDGERVELTWLAGGKGLVALAASTDYTVDPDFELIDTVGASDDDVTYDPEGRLIFATDGVADRELIIQPHQTGMSPWKGFKWSTDRSPHWECRIKTKTGAITSHTIWAGLKLTNTPVTATDDDQVFFRYQDTINAGRWQAISSVATVDDAHDSGKIVAAATRYHLAIMVDSNRRAHFYINGDLVEISSPLTNTLDTLIPFVGVKGNAKKLYVEGIAASRLRGA